MYHMKASFSTLGLLALAVSFASCGKRESEHEDKTDTFYACERSYGTFTRTFTLPSESIDLEHVSANLKDGVLSIVIPKRATQESKQIAVNPTEKAKA